MKRKSGGNFSNEKKIAVLWSDFNGKVTVEMSVVSWLDLAYGRINQWRENPRKSVMIVELSVFSWINVLKKSWVERKSQTRKCGQGIQSEKIFHREKIWVLSDSSCEDGRINRVEISPMERKSQYYHILTSKLAWLYCGIRLTLLRDSRLWMLTSRRITASYATASITHLSVV